VLEPRQIYRPGRARGYRGASSLVSPKATLDALVPAFNYFAAWYALAVVVFLFIGIKTRGRTIEELDAALVGRPGRVPGGRGSPGATGRASMPVEVRCNEPGCGRPELTVADAVDPDLDLSSHHFRDSRRDLRSDDRTVAEAARSLSRGGSGPRMRGRRSGHA
jgi:hypothetical protein